MCKISGKVKWIERSLLFLAFLWVMAMAAPLALAQKKSKADANAETDAKIKAINYSNIVWPNPPAIARIKYTNWYSSDKAARSIQGNKQKKSVWMDRLAGTQSNDEVFSRPFELDSALWDGGGFKGQSLCGRPESRRHFHFQHRFTRR